MNGGKGGGVEGKEDGGGGGGGGSKISGRTVVSLPNGVARVY